MKPDVINETTDSGPSTELKDGYIGIFTLIALVAIVCCLFWYKNYSPFLRAQHFNVIFNQVAGLDVNAAVYVNGLNVGSVSKLELDKHNRVVVGIRINNDKIIIPGGSTFRIYNNNVIGTRYIDIQLPEVNPAGPPLRPLDQSMVIVGHDPARAEVLLSNIADSLNGVDFRRAERRTEQDMQQLSDASQNVAVLSKKLQPVAENAMVVERDVSNLAREGRQTSEKMNHLLSNPALTSDLKDTAQRAKETADSLKETVAQLNSTLSDPKLRGDVLQVTDSLNQSAQHFETAANDFKNMSTDENLRGDIKQILTQANDSLDKLNNLLGQPQGNDGAGSTLAKTRAAVDHIDLAARQINQILDRRHPLLHMMVGRPGHIKTAAKDVAASHANQ
jgi:ABC-type transporter Mla subunit MlaD